MAGTLIIAQLSVSLLYSFIRHCPAALGIFIQTLEPNSRSEPNTYSWWLQRMKIQRNDILVGLALTPWHYWIKLCYNDNIYTWMDFQIYQEPWLCFYFQHHFFFFFQVFLHLSLLRKEICCASPVNLKYDAVWCDFLAKIKQCDGGSEYTLSRNVWTVIFL